MTSALVVGSGPNGLAAAITLAASGVDVTVVEAGRRIGGGTRSSELTLPGLMHDECSAFHPLSIDTAFSRLAGLERHGLRWAWADVQYSHPLDGGAGAAALRSVGETAAGLGPDDRAWKQVFGPLVGRFGEITPHLLGPLMRVPRHPVGLCQFGLRAAAPVSVLVKRFSSEAARGLYAGVAAHAFWSFRSVLSSAIGTVLGTAAHASGWPVAVGGSAAITTAMANALTERGGTIETGRRVGSVDEFGSFDLVMLDVSPRAAIELVGDAMPARFRRSLSGYRHGPAAFKVDFAVEGGVPWSHLPSRRAGTVHVGGTFREIATSESMVVRGQMPDRPFVLVGQQYLADPGRSVGDVHPVYSYAHVPSGFTGDVTEAIERQIERFAPGFRDRILARHVQSTAALSARNANVVRGDIVTGANSPRQLVFRPRGGVDPYWIGVQGHFLCSAATPPGAGAHGMCGYNAARSALRSIGRHCADDSGG
ncbi:phytoene desaturase family protein [Ilumatobacter nonamiensis]|uniref:phytoene desaturase family protein n=1 Tax=Ilumatobacter nonamiensis TaxID=467093 RepID=UPI0003463CAD|nr:NAD(P)/FAD-dependent oxidoreductase [Ilumatobacter nonamiensis]